MSKKYKTVLTALGSSHEKLLLLAHLSQTRVSYICVIDQAISVKMAGYWPSSFFAFLWTETKSRSTKTQEKNEANIQPS